MNKHNAREFREYIFEGISLELCYENSISVDGNQMSLGIGKNLRGDTKVYLFLCSSEDFVITYSFLDSKASSK